jgi:flagellar motor switch protein FliN/FliY
MESNHTTDKNPRPGAEELQELLENGFDPESSTETEQGADQAEQTPSRGLEFLYDVPLQVSVEVGRSKILLKDLLKMGVGHVIELDKMANEPLELYVNSRLIARGKAVQVGDRFGIKLTDVVSAADRIEKLG